MTTLLGSIVPVVVLIIFYHNRIEHLKKHWRDSDNNFVKSQNAEFVLSIVLMAQVSLVVMNAWSLLGLSSSWLIIGGVILAIACFAVGISLPPDNNAIADILNPICGSGIGVGIIVAIFGIFWTPTWWLADNIVHMIPFT